MSDDLMFQWKTTSVDETKRLGASLAPHLRDGDLISLVGDLGAGKTHFVQGVARAMGITDPVTSPTFNIAQEYRGGRSKLDHLDLYRLDDPSELEDIDYYRITDADSEGVAFVEWADKFPDEMPSDYLELKITVLDDGARAILATPFGDRARQLVSAWAEDAGAQMQAFES